MKSKWTLPLIIACVLLLTSVGCKKAEPDTPANDAPPPTQTAPPPPPDIPPAPSVSTDDERPNPLAGEIVEADRHARSTGLIGDVYFDFDKYELKDSARSQLNKNASFLKENGEFDVTIEGHCDERGTNAYNLALGDRRANAAAGYMATLGTGADRLTSVSYGEERSQCSTPDESCWSKNRRAHFVITGN